MTIRVPNRKRRFERPVDDAPAAGAIRVECGGGAALGQHYARAYRPTDRWTRCGLDTFLPRETTTMSRAPSFSLRSKELLALQGSLLFTFTEPEDASSATSLFH